MESAQDAASLLHLLGGQAVALGPLRVHLDVEQFVWELFGIYLSHRVSVGSKPPPVPPRAVARRAG